MDPIGLVFEGFDALGRDRLVDDDGQSVDVSGELTVTDIDGPLSGPSELVERLATSDQVRKCVVRQWFRFALGRAETVDDDPSLASMETAFDKSGYDLRTLMVSVVVTDVFRYRAVEDKP